MSQNIETSREPDGRWAARVASVPGLTAFGNTEEESLALARDLASILAEGRSRSRPVILGFYPGRIPEHASLAR